MKTILSETYGKAVAGVVGVILLVLLTKSVVFKPSVENYKPKENAPCEGEALVVDYPYHGGMLQPHACKPQCDDDVQRYILYPNGKATQCQILPGCLDWGEDQGVTCVPPEEDLSLLEEV